jgi:hypothetical protein
MSLLKRKQPAPMPVTERRPVSVVAPPPVYTQSQLRARRRLHLRVVYTGSFELTAEVAAIVRPLAKQMVAEPSPASHRAQVEDVADAVHALVSAVVGFIAEHDGRAKVQHLANRPDDRSKALRTIADLAPRPAAPVINGATAFRKGTWAALLVELARPFSVPLADALAAALPPEHTALNGAPSTSERLVNELRELDRAAKLLERSLERRAFFHRECPPPPPEVDRRTAEARATLAALGVEAPTGPGIPGTQRPVSRRREVSFSESDAMVSVLPGGLPRPQNSGVTP